jgi:polyisoprenyl-teichoic acid--peptidoglycan teichoic acid transferase
VVSALLSFVFPGLGQAYVRRWRAAAIFAVPTIALILLVLVQAAGGIERLAGSLINPPVALAVLVLIVLLGLWRLLGVGHAYIATSRSSSRKPGRLASVTLVVVTVAILLTHVVGAYYAWAFYNAGSRIFTGNNPVAAPGDSPSPGQTPDARGDAGDFVGGPPTTPATPTSRINILVTGIDAYRTRSEALNDTLLIISVDPATNTAVMISIPRDTSDFPLYSGGTYSGKINSLMTAAYLNPKQFPDGPIGTLTREVGFILGIPIHYYMAIDLAGFRKMIDLVGGVDVVNPEPIQDPLYDWLDGSPYGFYLSAGPHHLDGSLALAYVRSRQGLGDNDYTRAARQQQALIALKQKMIQPAMIAKLPSLLDAAAQTIKTDFPPDRITEMLDIARLIQTNSIQRFVLGPPYNYHPDSSTTGGSWTSRLYMDKVAALSVRLFGSDSAYYVPPPSAQPSASPFPIASP